MTMASALSRVIGNRQPILSANQPTCARYPERFFSGHPHADKRDGFDFRGDSWPLHTVLLRKGPSQGDVIIRCDKVNALERKGFFSEGPGCARPFPNIKIWLSKLFIP